jgi:hypothetical protein
MSKVSKAVVSLGIGLVFIVFVTASASAEMSKKAIQVGIEKSYDAKVLKISKGKNRGRSVFFVKVMFNGGNFNTAFQVNTLVIDSNTGKPLSQFHHESSGRQLSAAHSNSPNRQWPGALRGHVWR